MAIKRNIDSMTKKEFIELTKDMPDDAEIIVEGDEVLFFTINNIEYKENVECVSQEYIFNEITVNKAIILG